MTSVQVVAYNPVEDILASCSISDFGFWSEPKQQQGQQQERGRESGKSERVEKHKVDSKILSVAWRPDGQILAMGNIEGGIALSDRHGNIIASITRSAPIVSLAWSQYDFNRAKQTFLIAGCWDRTVEFLGASKLQPMSPKPKFQIDGGCPLCISLYGHFDEYILVSTKEDTMLVYNQMGVLVSTIQVDMDWIWYTKVDIDGGRIACKDHKGGIRMLDVKSRPLSCTSTSTTCNNSIVYTRCGTRIMVHDDSTTTTTTTSTIDQAQAASGIDCTSAIQGLGVGRTYIAVKLNSNTNSNSNSNANHIIQVYSKIIGTNGESSSSSIVNTPMCRHIHVSTLEIPFSFDQFAVVAARQVVIVNNDRLYLYEFDLQSASRSSATVVRTWKLPAIISCIQVMCDSIGHESILVGCADGSAHDISLGNAFVVEVFKLNEEIKSLSTSCSRRYVSAVDNNNQLHVYDRFQKSCKSQKVGKVSRVTFHETMEDLYCYDSNGTIIVQDVDSTLEVLGCKGNVVKFKDVNLITILGETIHKKWIDVSKIVEQKINNASYASALSIAELGVSVLVWEYLGYQSMLDLNLDVAESCFIYLGEEAKVSMIQRLKQTLKENAKSLNRESSIQLIASEIDITNGNFREAGRRLASIGEHKKAVNMFVFMGMFLDAQLAVSNKDKETILMVRIKEAEWEEGMKRWQNASELYLRSENFSKAVDCVEAAAEIELAEDSERWLTDQIYNIAKFAPVEEKDALNRCCDFLSQRPGNEARLKELLKKIGDYSKLIAFYIQNQAWLDVSKLCKEEEGNFDKTLLLPYANWLAGQGNIVEALQINREAGEEERNFKLLSFLIKDSIAQECYDKVSELYFLVATILFEIEPDRKEIFLFAGFDNTASMSACDMKHTSVLYHVYDQIIDHASGLFFTTIPNNILQGCVFLINNIKDWKAPAGISMTKLMLIFCRLARDLGGFFSTRVGYDVLSTKLSISGQEKEILADDIMTIEVSIVCGL